MERCSANTHNPSALRLATAHNLFSLLTPSESEELAHQQSLVTFKKSGHLFRSGAPVQGIFCIVAGVVKVSQPVGSQTVTLRFATAGDWIGHRSIFTSDTYRGSAMAKTPVRAYFVPTATVLRFFSKNTAFAHQLIRHIAHDLEAAERKLFQDRQRTVPTRLISLFRDLDQKFGVSSSDGRHLSLALSKVEIAELVGASPEVVSRQLSRWKKADLLHETGKHMFLSSRLLERLIR